MLRALQIENYAIIKSLHLTFDSGFTAITGETGAGKSILLGALSLILGHRVDNSILYDKSKKCFIEGSFDIKNLNLDPFFANNDLDYQDLTILRREISETGKSRAFINDTPVNLSQLKELAQYLVDIHSQNHHLLIENQNFKLQIVDDFAQNGSLLTQYKDVLKQYKSIESELDLLKEFQNKALLEKDFFEFQAHELNEAKLNPGELDDIEKQIAILSHADLIKTSLQASTHLISNKEDNILHLLNELKNTLHSVASFDDKLNQLFHRLDSLVIELKDIDFEINTLEDEVDVNPETLSLLSDRFDLLNRLLQKHRVHTLDELIHIETEINRKLLDFSDNQSKIEQLEQQKEELYQQVFTFGDQISQQRTLHIPSLEAAIGNHISTIGMPNGKIKIELEKTNHFYDNGIDKVSFLFSANKGIPLAEIEKVASGGEMSRLMLAIKAVISQNSYLPTIIFDEIDTGISGDTAFKVAQLMQNMASDRQLLAITHLPQIAAKAKLHYFVYKEIVDDKTFTNVKKIDQDERIEVIAGMISGASLSESSRMTAKELITQN